MIRSPATLRAPILPVSRYSTMSGAISVENMRTRTGASVSLRIWCAPSLPRGNATTSPWRSCCSPSCVRSVGSREPTLRTHEGEQQLRQGDVVAFPRGKEGAHQIRNDTDAPVRVLMFSTLIAPDIVEYLDTGKIGARSVAGERIIFARPGPELEYWEDED